MRLLSLAEVVEEDPTGQVWQQRQPRLVSQATTPAEAKRAAGEHATKSSCMHLVAGRLATASAPSPSATNGRLSPFFLTAREQEHLSNTTVKGVLATL